MSPLRKSLQNQGKRPSCWFWRIAQGEEIDLLIEIGPRQFLAVEYKVAVEIEKRSLKGFMRLRGAL